MSEFVTWPEAAGKDQQGNPTSVTRGINPMLVTHFETKPQGGALLHLMGGGQVEVNQGSWEQVAAQIAPPSEPRQSAK